MYHIVISMGVNIMNMVNPNPKQGKSLSKIGGHGEWEVKYTLYEC